MKDAIKVVSILPNSGEGYFLMGKVLFALEEYEKAGDSFKMGISYGDENCQQALESLNDDIKKQHLCKMLKR